MKMRAAPNSRHIAVFALLLSLSQSPGLFAQKNKSGKESSDKSQTTFKVSAESVVVNATVSDKDGRAVTDLAQKDFKVYEDGKLQDIRTFALESYKPIPAEKAEPKKATTETETTEAPNFTRPRLVSLIIDDIASYPEDRFFRVVEAVKKYIERDMGPGDQIAIVSLSGKVQYPFSDDKQILLDEAATLQQKLYWNQEMTPECLMLTDQQAKRIIDIPFGSDNLRPDYAIDEKGEVSRDHFRVAMQDAYSSAEGFFAIAIKEVLNCRGTEPKNWNWMTIQEKSEYDSAKTYARQAALVKNISANNLNRTLLITLRRYLRSLRHFDAAKSAILLSDGFLHEDVIYQLQEVIEEALRSGIVLNTVNVRGLWTYPVVSGSGSDGETLRYKPGFIAQDISAQEIPLNQLANETGGVYYHDNNDLYAGIHQISSRQDYYYILTYAMPSQKPDGRYHSIKLEVTRPDLKISYRKGYYAPKEEMTFEQRKKEDILEALRAPGDLNEIPMSLSYNYHQEGDAIYAVSLLMNVDVRRLNFLEEDSRRKNLISMIIAAFDENDHYIDGLDKSVDFRLTDESYTDLMDRGMKSRIEFKLPMGRYKIKAIVREAFQGKMGSLTKSIEIP
jgi:VWFA-related protein